MTEPPRPPRVRITYVGAPEPRSGPAQPGAADTERGSSSGATGRLVATVEAAVVRRVAGQRWWVRAPLLPLLSWFTLQHASDFNYSGIYDGANLILHEAGHLLLMWSGNDFVAAAGGTFFNFVVPLLAAAAFWRRDDAFAATVCLWWAGTVLVTAGPYIADAQLMVLPTVSVGPGPGIHDWNYMLGELGILDRHRGVASLFRATGLGILVAALAAGTWVLAIMRRTPSRGVGAGGGPS